MKPVDAGILPVVVSEELDLLERVRQAVRSAAIAAKPDMADVNRRLIELRDEASSALQHDLPALFDQLNVHHSLSKLDFRTKLPDLRAPYFAHMRINEAGRSRDILIGHQTFIDPKFDITIIDWKNAPIAKVFFHYNEGDSFTEKLPGKLLSGTIEARRVLTFDKGKLIAIGLPTTGFKIDDDGHWHEQTASALPQLSGGEGAADRGQRFGTGRGGQRMPDVSALLDKQQFELLTRSEDEHLLILGGAGCGKTTVALHRLAALSSRHPKRFAHDRMLVVVPDTGLVRLSRKILKSLGLDRVKVSTYDEWIIQLARNWLKSLPNRICQDTPARVSRFKRHPAMLELFDSLADRRLQSFTDQAERELGFWSDIRHIFERSTGHNLSLRLQSIRNQLLNRLQKQGSTIEEATLHRRAVENLFGSLKRQLLNLDTDRRALYSDRETLMRAVQMSDGVLNESMVDEVMRHARQQFQDPDTSARMAGIGDEAIVSLDGVDVATEESIGVESTVDIEDCSLMFRLLKYYTGSVCPDEAKFPSFSHLVIDEAQELSPLELRMLGDCLAEDGSVTIAGDAAQQSDPTTTFVTWEHVLRELDIGDVQASQLMTNYRSPRPIAEYAHAILGKLAPETMPRALRDGVPVIESQFSDLGHVAMILTDTLEDLCFREPDCSVAIICRDDESAVEIFGALRELSDVRLVRDGEFSFEPGIDVTEASHVKGLEFDYVVVPDADINNYPDLPDARRLLHVAATRAMHQLWIMYRGRVSPILPQKFASGSQ
jgi:DNA helicase-2/ATP-dependent DNA helicase PcrA